MPLTYIRPFRLRYYECSADGLLHHANYLRYMQEAAFDASAAAGYDVVRYETMGCIWLVRVTDLEIFHPLRYPGTVEVKTWVADLRRVRSIRAYEFRLPRSERPVARALTDWAFLNRTTGRPAAIPKEMRSAFFPEGAHATAPPRPHTPAMPQPPTGAHYARRRVEWSDLDAAQHINNAVYLAYVEEGQMRAASALGWNLKQLRADGLAMQMRRLHIEYLQPATVGEELEICTWAADPPGTNGVWFSAIQRIADGVSIAQARTEWACVKMRSDPGTSESFPLA